MNIVTPIPTTVVFTTANVNTESARRDNALRETVPQPGGNEKSASESGLGSESDRVKNPGQQPQPVTYEKPQNNNTQNADGQGNPLNKDNGEDPSAGKENAESQQQAQQEQAEKAEIEELEARDREVREHEQAHAAAGGEHAGSPQYEFETGPNGQQYAVGGEVSIDISAESSPEETLRKMQQVRAAALAPAEPSPQDLRVATEATQKSVEARAELAEERAEEAKQAYSNAFPESEQAQEAAGQQGPDLDDIVKGIDSGSPVRSLKEDPVAEAAGLESSSDEFRRLRETRDTTILKRVSVIENFYQAVSEPRSQGLQQSA